MYGRDEERLRARQHGELVPASDPHAVSDEVAFVLLVLLLAGVLALTGAVIAGVLYVIDWIVA